MDPDNFDYMVASHIDHFTPQHTSFEQTATCLSVMSYFLVLYRLQYCDTLVNFREKHLHDYELQMSDYNI